MCCMNKDDLSVFQAANFKCFLLKLPWHLMTFESSRGFSCQSGCFLASSADLSAPSHSLKHVMDIFKYTWHREQHEQELPLPSWKPQYICQGLCVLLIWQSFAENPSMSSACVNRSSDCHHILLNISSTCENNFSTSVLIGNLVMRVLDISRIKYSLLVCRGRWMHLTYFTYLFFYFNLHGTVYSQGIQSVQCVPEWGPALFS